MGVACRRDFERQATRSNMSKAKSSAETTRVYRLKGEVGGVELALPLSEGSNAVGSDPFNELILDHDGVSRHHAMMVVEAGRILVVDRDSKNGSFVNSRRVRQAEVGVGDALGFGPVELLLEELHPDDAKLAVELPATPGRQRSSRELETTAASRPRDHPLLRWFHLISRFAQLLGRSRASGMAPALAVLTEELPSGGACLLELADSEPTVVAAHGEIDQAALDEVTTSWQRRMAAVAPEAVQRDAAPSSRRRKIFVTRPAATGLLCVESGDSRGLLVAGDFTGRRGSEPLLATLLELCVQLGPRPLRASERASAAACEVIFPSGCIPGTSAAMQAVYAHLGSLAEGDLPVLIAGETGVGKELIARSLHLSSTRRSAPLVAINCAAIPSELLEAELFGIGDRVATGVAGRRGVFQQAEGGTLFLDEIGEMPSELQAKLLRVLEEKRLRPVGAAPVAIDVRIVAATNADLKALIEQRGFRRDLFFRIAGFVLRVPPLRRRREDIPALVEGFLRQFSEELGKSVRGVSLRALRALTEREWQGNVRELEHEIRRLVTVCPPGQAIESSMVEASPLAGIDEPQGTGASAGKEAAAIEGDSRAGEDATVDGDARIEEAAGGWARAAGEQPGLELADCERELVREALKRARGNQVQAAKLLGISRHGLRRRIDRYQLRDWFDSRGE